MNGIQLIVLAAIDSDTKELLAMYSSFLPRVIDQCDVIRENDSF